MIFYNLDIIYTVKIAIIVLPAGSGKSIVLADIANRLDDNILIFCPSREILKQNYEKMSMINPFGCAIFSASFNSKDVGKVTFATIGSVKSHPELFQHFKYVMVDEAHQCNPKQGMYKEFFEALGQTKILGLTATPYRLSSYMGGSMLKFITRTRPNIFSKVIYQVQISTLLDMGYLSKISYYQLSPTGWNESRLKVNTTGADYTDKSVIMEYQRVDFYGFFPFVQRFIARRFAPINRQRITVDCQHIIKSLDSLSIILFIESTKNTFIPSSLKFMS